MLEVDKKALAQTEHFTRSLTNLHTLSLLYKTISNQQLPENHSHRPQHEQNR